MKEKGGTRSSNHIAVLDGWRALSIVLVLAGHWLPLGPATWQMNSAIAASGMALFFCLSGFLITHFLLQDHRVFPFILKRGMRILPLAWTALICVLVAWGGEVPEALANFLFVANLFPDMLLPGGHHLWSLCVEMQFYVLVALLVSLGGRFSLYLLPFLCLAATALRIADQQIISIVTWHRIDEILVGGCIALWWHHRDARTKGHQGIFAWLPLFALTALVASANPHSGELGYLRPYFAALAVGGSLAAFPAALERAFSSSAASYVAKISYGLYVIHGVLTETWLGGKDADSATRYALRIPLTAVTWLGAHASARYFESFFTGSVRNYLARREAQLNPLVQRDKECV